jgi:hypothetical protein
VRDEAKNSKPKISPLFGKTPSLPWFPSMQFFDWRILTNLGEYGDSTPPFYNNAQKIGVFTQSIPGPKMGENVPSIILPAHLFSIKPVTTRRNHKHG